MSMVNYKLNLKNHIKFLLPSISLISLSLVLVLYLMYIGINLDLNNIFIFFPFYILILPAIILHYRFYQNDKGKSVEFKKKEFVIKQKDETEVCVAYSNLENIILLCRNMNDGYSWLPWSKYYYCIFYLKDGSKLILTCLLLNNFFLHSLQVPIKIDHKAFPWL